MKKAHAEHNRELCDKIIGIGTHNDWVITTAFYSAIHFVDHSLFQNKLDHGGNLLSDIEHAKRVINSQNKHDLREMLVKLHIPKIAIQFSYLYKNCRTARYIDYRISNEIATLSRKYLTSIEFECCKTV